MPSGSDFKYSTGDTTAWKSKYYALVDYTLSVGASVADIEAFLDENSSFAPGSAPTALASLNAVTATTSDNLEYQISHGTPYESLTANLWFLVRMPTANAGAMTLKVDALGPRSVYVGGVAMAGGELTAGGAYFFAYNTTADRFDVVGASGSPVKSVTVDDTDSVYTLASSDLGGVHTVAVGLSGGSVDIKELALAAMNGIVRVVVTGWDGVGQSYRVRLLDSADNEIWTGYAAGDFIDLAYDGSTRTILDERVTVEGFLYLSANEGASSGHHAIFDNNGVVDRDIGNWWDSATNFRVDIAFDCLIDVRFHIQDPNGNAPLPRIAVNGGHHSNYVLDYKSTDGNKFESVSHQLALDAGDFFYFRAYGPSTGYDAQGGATLNDTGTIAYWTVIRRRR